MPVLYLIMRSDLPSLNPGKLAAQAAHCANVAVKRMSGHPSLKAWIRNGSRQGYGVTIVLGGDLKKLNSLPNKVWDDSYPCKGGRTRRVLVGCWFLVEPEFKPRAIRNLRLYP